MLLLDALDQFEPTPRARYLTWLPALWPANARLIAPAQPGPAAGALTGRAGATPLALPPLSLAEAGAIAQRLCQRYHRTLNPAVLAALLAKGGPDGQPAAGNPLWLALAVEELNLLDADDFARLERDFSGPPEQRLQALLLAVVAEFPGDAKALYGWLLRRAEALFGPLARAFVELIAVSRSGWRDSDWPVLLPPLTGQAWDDLPLAALRRTFRAQVIQRGAQGQWDFAHAQLRQAVLDQMDGPRRQQRHRGLADHLLARPADDPLHETETLVHLMGADDRERAAAYYAGDRTPGELAGATAALAAHILSGEEGLAWAVGLLTLAAPADQRHRLCQHYLFDLDEALSNDARLDTRRRLLESVRQTLQELTAQDPGNAEWQRDLAASHSKVGDVLTAQGDIEGALAAYRASLAIRERLTRQDPGNARWQRDLAASHNEAGNMLTAQGDLEGAPAACRPDLAITERLARQDPGNVQWQRDVWMFCGLIGTMLELTGNAEAQTWWRRAYEILAGMEQAGIFLSPTDRELLAQLAARLDGLNQTEPVAIPLPYPGTDANRAQQLNIQYQQDLAAWKVLPWWRRLRVKKPKPPEGI